MNKKYIASFFITLMLITNAMPMKQKTSTPPQPALNIQESPTSKGPNSICTLCGDNSDEENDNEEDGFNLEIKDADEVTQATYNNNITQLQTLLAEGKSPNGSSPYLPSPLHVAAEKGHLECLQILITYNACVDAAATISFARGLTPLHCSTIDGHIRCALALINAGANPAARITAEGKYFNETPAQSAWRHGHYLLAGLLKYYEYGKNNAEEDIFFDE